LTQAKGTTNLCSRFQFREKASVNLIADERYNPLKSRTKEGSIR
jgi:hypothetical protein